ncbi:hypothetical protein RV14_GL001872 [Enterococcus ratti]|uniref:Uncharacterized protein n=1 Tax=Enterococcus ratti TaxID=150033 RepID=A0A1L8WQA1_9ENTE|nr:hypothetical protein RV14_GL001872 [Enterococcus ratti]
MVKVGGKMQRLDEYLYQLTLSLKSNKNESIKYSAASIET